VAKEQLKTLNLKDITVDPRLQMRVHVDPKEIEDLVEALELKKERDEEPVLDGDGKIPVVFQQGTTNWLADGFKRHAAYGRFGAKKMQCVVRPGGFEDARRFAWSANATHGKKRTREDMERAVLDCLEANPNESNVVISRLCTVSEFFVRTVKKNNPTSIESKSTERVGLDGRTINTANIGKKPVAPTEHPPTQDDGRPWQGGPQHGPSDGPDSSDARTSEPPEFDPDDWRTHPLTRLKECHLPSATIRYLAERAAMPSGDGLTCLGDVADALEEGHDVGLGTNQEKVRAFLEDLARAEAGVDEEEKPAKRKQTTKGEALADALGKPVPSHLRDVFGDPWLEDLLAKAEGWQKAMQSKAIAAALSGKAAAYGYLRAGDALKHLANAIDAVEQFAAALKAGTFHAVHPRCEGKGCKDCRSVGAVPEWRYEELLSQGRWE
jgi:hypothetical protein